MAKIILTQKTRKNGTHVKVLVDTNWSFSKHPDGGSYVKNLNGNEYIWVVESLEEIAQIINQLEQQISDDKLNKILANQKRILENQKAIYQILDTVFGDKQ